jgi:hypothetical protein
MKRGERKGERGQDRIADRMKPPQGMAKAMGWASVRSTADELSDEAFARVHFSGLMTPSGGCGSA